MKYIKCFVVLFAMILLLTSCDSNNFDSKNVLGVQLSPDNINIAELSTKKYLDDELNSIANFEGTVEDLNRIYPVECFREFKDGYRIVYCGESKICYLTFDINGVKVFGRVYDCLKTKDDFIDIILGQSVDSVIAIDPKGDYVFLYTESEGSRISTHFTKDGYMIMIHYDDSLLVEKIDCELI